MAKKCLCNYCDIGRDGQIGASENIIPDGPNFVLEFWHQ
jgi:hypothetical protein